MDIHRSVFNREFGFGLVFASLAAFASGCASKTVYESQADREGIRNVVKAHLREVGKCYENELEKVGLLEGKLVLSWEINGDGRAENVTVKQGGPKIDPVAPCVIDRLKTWQFPKPSNDEIVTVDYPFYFSENGNL